jgi:hypothetical protein
MNKRKQKRVRRVPGDFVKIPLGDAWHSYGRVLKEPLFAFHDVRSDKELSIDEIATLPILFKIWVTNRAVTSGRWRVVGKRPLEGHLVQTPRFFKQDALKPEQLSIYYEDNGVHESPAKPEEVVGLERAAVWDPEHVEDRLRDHFAGKPNKWAASLNLKRIGVGG